MTRTDRLECWSCGHSYAITKDRLLCDCGGPLEVVYAHDTPPARPGPDTGHGIWRWADLVPEVPAPMRVSLGEGATPLVELPTLTERTGRRFLVKDEGSNPGGSFKARGASIAVSVLRGLGWTAIAMPTVGSGGSAWSAYCARAGIAAHVGLPRSLPVPEIAHVEPPLYGATTAEFDGPLKDAFARFRASVAGSDAAYVGALAEPYRIEGEKTILFEVVEQLGWTPPDAVVWPTGGAAGLVGLVKAREELDRVGWLADGRDTLVIAAQHDSGGPLADALRSGADAIVESEPGGPAPGVWVGSPFAAEPILRRIRRSATASGVLVGDDDIHRALRDTARSDGVLLSPEGAVAVAAAETACREGSVPTGGTVVCVNTAAPYRYPDVLRAASRDAVVAAGAR